MVTSGAIDNTHKGDTKHRDTFLRHVTHQLHNNPFSVSFYIKPGVTRNEIVVEIPYYIWNSFEMSEIISMVRWTDKMLLSLKDKDGRWLYHFIYGGHLETY